MGISTSLLTKWECIGCRFKCFGIYIFLYFIYIIFYFFSFTPQFIISIYDEELGILVFVEHLCDYGTGLTMCNVSNTPIL